MRRIDIFSSYFFILMIIQGSILAFFDSRNFNKKNLKGMGKKAKIMGIGSIMISFFLYLFNVFTV